MVEGGDAAKEGGHAGERDPNFPVGSSYVPYV